MFYEKRESFFIAVLLKFNVVLELFFLSLPPRIKPPLQSDPVQSNTHLRAKVRIRVHVGPTCGG